MYKGREFINYGCLRKRNLCQDRHITAEEHGSRDLEVGLRYILLQKQCQVQQVQFQKYLPSLLVLLVSKYMQKRPLQTASESNHHIWNSFYRKMCFKYKQVNLNKHLEFNSLLIVRDCLHNQLNINYISNSTRIRFPEDRIRDSLANEFTVVNCCPRIHY